MLFPSNFYRSTCPPDVDSLTYFTVQFIYFRLFAGVVISFLNAFAKIFINVEKKEEKDGRLPFLDILVHRIDNDQSSVFTKNLLIQKTT